MRSWMAELGGCGCPGRFPRAQIEEGFSGGGRLAKLPAKTRSCLTARGRAEARVGRRPRPLLCGPTPVRLGHIGKVKAAGRRRRSGGAGGVRCKGSCFVTPLVRLGRVTGPASATGSAGRRTPWRWEKSRPPRGTPVFTGEWHLAQATRTCPDGGKRRLRTSMALAAEGGAGESGGFAGGRFWKRATS